MIYRKLYLVLANGMRAVVDDEVVVAVNVHRVEPEHEPLQDGLGLEGDHALDVALVLGHDDGAVHRPGNVGQEALVALLADLTDWN